MCLSYNSLSYLYTYALCIFMYLYYFTQVQKRKWITKNDDCLSFQFILLLYKNKDMKYLVKVQIHYIFTYHSDLLSNSFKNKNISSTWVAFNEPLKKISPREAVYCHINKNGSKNTTTSVPFSSITLVNQWTIRLFFKRRSWNR